MDFLIWGGFFSWCVNLGIAIFVLTKNNKNSINIVYGVSGLSIGGWSVGSFLLNFFSSPHLTLFLIRACHIFAFFVPSLLYHFCTLLVGTTHKRKKIINIFYTASVLFLPFTFSPLFIRGTEKYGRYITVIAGPVQYIFMLFFAAFTVVFLAELIRGVRNTSIYLKKKQLKVFIIAAVFALSAGLVYFGGVLRIIPDIYIGDDYFLLVWFLVSAYNIIKYRFLEIDTVIHKTLLWILTSASVLVPIGILLSFSRRWLRELELLPLTLVTTALFYLFLYYFRKIQPKIDHLFRRRKYDYYQVLADIPQRIGSELDLKHITSNLLKQLKDVLYIRNGLIFILEPAKTGYFLVDSLGDDSNNTVGTLNSSSKLSNWLSLNQKALEREQVEVDPQYAPIKEEALSFFKESSLEVAIPITMEDKLTAILGIGRKETLSSYTLRDIELLEHIGSQIGITIDNALHHEDIVEKERLAEELRLGRDIQMNLLPKELPQLPSLAVDGLMLPAKEIGGDYYDFIPLCHCEEPASQQAAATKQSQTPAPDSLAIVIGDVSGKGVAAGLLMAMAKTAIHTLSQEDRSPKEVLLRTNQILYSHIGGQKFMTMLYFKYNPSSRLLTYSSAGHEHILIYRAQDYKVESILSGGFMLGMLEDIEAYLEEHSITLNPKDKVLLYTDGVTEAEDAKGERFGLERLIESFKRHSQKPPGELILSIKDEVYAFMGSQPQYDDITLVGMEACLSGRQAK